MQAAECHSWSESPGWERGVHVSPSHCVLAGLEDFDCVCGVPRKHCVSEENESFIIVFASQ